MQQCLHAGLRSLLASFGNPSTAGDQQLQRVLWGGQRPGAVQRLAMTPVATLQTALQPGMTPPYLSVPSPAAIGATTGAPQRSLNPKSKIRNLALKVCLSPDLISTSER